MSSPRCPGCGGADEPPPWWAYLPREEWRSAVEALGWVLCEAEAYHEETGHDEPDGLECDGICDAMKKARAAWNAAALRAASVRAGVDGLDRECVRAALGAWVGTSEIDDESVDTFSAAYKAALSAPDRGSSLIPRCVACGKDLVLGPMGWHCVTDHDPGEVAP
jgi:hypothetical protein